MHIFKFYTLLLFGTLLFGCGKDTPKPDPAVMPEQVLINHPDSVMAIGSADTIVARVFPENATDKSLEWSSNNPMVVSVDADGRIIALQEGLATITATTKTGGVSNAVNVRVDSDQHHVAGWLEYYTIPNRTFTAIEVHLSNSSNTAMTIKNVEVFASQYLIATAQSGTFVENIPARSKTNHIFTYDHHSTSYSNYYIKVYFLMKGRNFAITIRNGTYTTEPGGHISIGSDTEWDGDNTIEIP